MAQLSMITSRAAVGGEHQQEEAISTVFDGHTPVVVIQHLLGRQQQVAALADVRELSSAYNKGELPRHVAKNGSNFHTLLGITEGMIA